MHTDIVANWQKYPDTLIDTRPGLIDRRVGRVRIRSILISMLITRRSALGAGKQKGHTLIHVSRDPYQPPMATDDDFHVNAGQPSDDHFGSSDAEKAHGSATKI